MKGFVQWSYGAAVGLLFILPLVGLARSVKRSILYVFLYVCM
jgi:hypothetical protein